MARFGCTYEVFFGFGRTVDTNKYDRFDKGYWHKDKETWNSVKKAKWDDVILEDAKKKAIQDDVLRFFRAEERYKGLGVPWKRGVIVSCPRFVTSIAAC